MPQHWHMDSLAAVKLQVVLPLELLRMGHMILLIELVLLVLVGAVVGRLELVEVGRTLVPVGDTAVAAVAAVGLAAGIVVDLVVGLHSGTAAYLGLVPDTYLEVELHIPVQVLLLRHRPSGRMDSLRQACRQDYQKDFLHLP